MRKICAYRSNKIGELQMAKSNVKRNKIPVLVTYSIAVMALLVGLIIPMDNLNASFSNIMPLMQIPGALVALGILKKLPFGATLTPDYSSTISIFGTSVNIGAILLLAYALVTLLALVLLIPVCVASRKSQTSRRVAVIAEILALTVLLALVAREIIRHNSGWNLNVFIPFGVTLLMLILQSLICFGLSGLIKTVTLGISAVAAFAAICNISYTLPVLADPIGKVLEKLQWQQPFATAAGLYSLGQTTYFGNTLISLLFGQDVLTPADQVIGVVNIIALALSILVCVNLLLNVFGLGKRTNGFMLICNVVRYAAEILLIIALFGTLLWFKGNFGLSLYLLTVLAIIQLIIALARLINRRLAKKARNAEDFDEDADIADSDDEYAFEPALLPLPAGAKPVATAPAGTASDRRASNGNSVVYSVGTYYTGPTDSFIRKLNNSEKIEFAKVFLERSAGNLAGVPDYIVGGDNSRFFSSVFIYFPRVRDIVSDGLMNKLYEEVNLLR